MIVAEGDDITMWDHEIRAFNSIPTSKKRLFVVDHTTHMVLYSNRSQLEIAADQGARWFCRAPRRAVQELTASHDARNQTFVDRRIDRRSTLRHWPSRCRPEPRPIRAGWQSSTATSS